jgi:hypothetical protein
MTVKNNTQANWFVSYDASNDPADLDFAWTD